MGYGPDPEHAKHANRKHGLPWNDTQGTPCMSGQHMLKSGNPRIRNMVGPGQEVSDMSKFTQYLPTDDGPTNWVRPHTCMIPPRVVILSAFICWGEMWDTCVMEADMQVSDNVRLFKYSGIEQFIVNPALPTGLAPKYPDNTVDQVGQQIIGTGVNKQMQEYRDLKRAFREAKVILESLPQPIYCIIPEWLPDEMPMQPNRWRKTILTPTGRPIYKNALPVYTYPEVFYTFWFPNDRDERTSLPWIDYGGAPSLRMRKPGFGTNVLHLYVGHFATRKANLVDPDPSIARWRSWGQGPWGALNDATYAGNYYGGNVIPGEAGRRRKFDWNIEGWGYTAGSNLTAFDFTQDTQDIVDNFYKFRNYQTQIFGFKEGYEFTWDGLDKLWTDRLPYTESIFYTGFPSLCDIPNKCNEDSFYLGETGPFPFDDPPGGQYTGNLALADHLFYIPDSNTMRLGIAKLSVTIENTRQYYDTITPGTETFFTDVFEAYGLWDYGFNVMGERPEAFMEGASLAKYIIDYFEAES